MPVKSVNYNDVSRHTNHTDRRRRRYSTDCYRSDNYKIVIAGLIVPFQLLCKVRVQLFLTIHVYSTYYDNVMRLGNLRFIYLAR